ncbi:MAG: hypothetical protein CMJ46_00695 [Planctomyces sp.]|nr:hypothetical protein [Planctomyces sp.]
MDEFLSRIQACKVWCEETHSVFSYYVKALKRAVTENVGDEGFGDREVLRTSVQVVLDWVWGKRLCFHENGFSELFSEIERRNINHLEVVDFGNAGPVSTAVEALFIILDSLDRDIVELPWSEHSGEETIRIILPDEMILEAYSLFKDKLLKYDETLIKTTGMRARLECLRIEEQLKLEIHSPPKSAEKPVARGKSRKWIGEALLELSENPGMSDNQIAKSIGKSHTTLRRSKEWQGLRQKLEHEQAGELTKGVQLNGGVTDGIISDPVSRMYEDE